jgi:hypothetical protein
MGYLLGESVHEPLELVSQAGRRSRSRQGADDDALPLGQDSADDGRASVGLLDPDRTAVTGFGHGPNEVARDEPGEHPACGRRRHGHRMREGSEADPAA